MIRRILRQSRSRAFAPQAFPIRRRGLLTTSYSVGPEEPLLLQQTVPQHFASIVSRYGDRNAVISRAQQQRLTYEELDNKSNALAKGLQGLGVKKGERVGVSLGNNIEFAVVCAVSWLWNREKLTDDIACKTTYALFKLGAILVPLNPSFNSAQVISALTHLDAAHLIIGAETNLAFKDPRENLSLLRQISPDLIGRSFESASIPTLKNIVIVDNSAGRIDVSKLSATTIFQDLLLSTTSTSAPRPDSTLDPHDIVNIQFTSGTTSMPKAAALSHLSILNNGYFIGSRMQLTERDIVCCPPPLFHCFGCILGYMATATHGSAIVFPTEAFNPEATLLSIQEEKATALYGVATMFVAELELLADGIVPYKGFEHLRTGIAAGSSVPSTLMKKLHDTLNLTGLTICYGMTETSPVSCMTTPDDPLIKRLDSVGRLMPHTKAKVVNPEDPHTPLPIGTKGELAVSGYLVMKGYWGDAEKTAEVMIKSPDENGKEVVWMHTGDEAEMDEDGYVKITGRLKDLIIRGGENIHPLEVENVLFAHEAVAQASVVGLPDKKYGECVAAFVIVHHGVVVEEDVSAADKTKAEESTQSGTTATPDVKGRKVLTRKALKDWVRENLSNHLVPKYIFWAHDYPKTASGKIQKFKLRDEGIRFVAEGKGI